MWKLGESIPGSAKLWAAISLVIYLISLVLPVTRETLGAKEVMSGWDVMKWGWASGSIPLTIAYASNFVLIGLMVWAVSGRKEPFIWTLLFTLGAAILGLFPHISPGNQYRGAHETNFITPWASVWILSFVLGIVSELKLTIMR